MCWPWNFTFFVTADDTLPVVVLPFAGLAAQVWRYRQAGPESRRQTRLVVLALGTLTLAFAVLAVLDPELEQGVGDLVVTTPRLQALYELQLLLVLTAALFLLPISIAVSVLRYRLLDIDIVINRAVIYGCLAAFIGAVYIAAVCLLPELVTAQTGNKNLYFGGTSILIVVSVTMDTVAQIQSHLLAHQYEGLIKKSRLRPTRR